MGKRVLMAGNEALAEGAIRGMRRVLRLSHHAAKRV